MLNRYFRKNSKSLCQEKVSRQSDHKNNQFIDLPDLDTEIIKGGGRHTKAESLQRNEGFAFFTIIF